MVSNFVCIKDRKNTKTYQTKYFTFTKKTPHTKIPAMINKAYGVEKINVNSVDLIFLDKIP